MTPDCPHIHPAQGREFSDGAEAGTRFQTHSLLHHEVGIAEMGVWDVSAEADDPLGEPTF
jgi:hypothetical protein